MISSTENAEYYTWGDNCDGWHLLKTDNLSVIEESMPVGTQEKMHLHQIAQQLFYILSGEATFIIDDLRAVVKAKQSIHIVANTKHSISNSGDQDLKFLVISAPKAHGDRVELERE